MKIDETYELMVKQLCGRLFIPNPTSNDILRLVRSCEYADPNNFVETPKTMKEVIMKQIFWVRAESYWRRKMAELFDVEGIGAADVRKIRERE